MGRHMAIDYVIAGILTALSVVIWLMGGGQMLLLLFPVLLVVAVLMLMSRERWQRLGLGWVVIPLLGLGLLFLALVWVHLWRCGAPWSCPGEVAAGVQGTKAPPVLPDDGAGLSDLGSRIAFVLFSLGLLYLIPKYLHLLTVFVRAVFLIRPSRVEHFASPLPSQKKVIAGLRQVSLERDDPAANVIALRGGWGSGKTACMRLFEAEISPVNGVKPQDGAVTVWFDCWRHQSDSSPELSIYWEAANNYHLLWPFGWLTIPVLRLYLAQMPLVLKGDWKLGNGQISVEGQPFKEAPKALFWQRHLGMLVAAALRRRYRRVVFVLEDIDRCPPYAAQVFVTLVRRFLAVSGVTIILPHVQEQMTAKVFHPLNYQLPDLAATTHAVLMSSFGDRIDMEPVFEKIQSRMLEGECAGHDGEHDSAKKEKGSGRPTEFSRSPPDLARSWLWSQLARLYMGADKIDRRRISQRMADKYLSDVIEDVPSLSPEDCVDLLARRLKEHTAFGRLFPLHDRELRKALAQKLGELWGRDRQVRIEARQFCAALDQALLCIEGEKIKNLASFYPKEESPKIPGNIGVLFSILLLALKYADARVAR